MSREPRWWHEAPQQTRHPDTSEREHTWVIPVGAVVFAVVMLYALRAHRLAIFLIVAGLAVTALVVLWRQAERSQRRDDLRERMRAPSNFARQAFPKLGWTEAKLTSKNVTAVWTVAAWPYDCEDQDGAQIHLRHAPGWDGDMDKITDLASRIHGGIWEVERDFNQDHVILTRTGSVFRWPASLTYATLHRITTDGKITIGVMDGGEPFVWDPTSTTPHALVAGTTGSGKTSAMRVIITEWVRNGGIVDIIDGKDDGDFDCFLGNPSVKIHTTPAGFVAVVQFYLAERDHRKDIRGPARDHLTRRLLVVDEAYEAWSLIATAPGLGRDAKAGYASGLVRFAQTARSVRLHLLVGTQRPTTEALTGDQRTGSLLRAQLAFKIHLGAGLDDNACSMLYARGTTAPQIGTAPGRGAWWRGGSTFTEFQSAWLGSAEANRLAAGPGRFADPEPDVAAWEDELARPNEPEQPPVAESGSGGWRNQPHQPPTRAHARPARDSAPPTPPGPTRAGDLPLAPGQTRMTCLACSHEWLTRAKSRTVVKCPACSKGRRVPVPK